MSGTGKALSIYSKLFGVLFFIVTFAWYFLFKQNELTSDAVGALIKAAFFLISIGLPIDLSKIAKNALQKDVKNIYNQDDKKEE